MKHKISNFKIYPDHHQWVTNSSLLNLYSNIEVRIGETIVKGGKEYIIEELTEGEVTGESFSINYVGESTKFYTLRIKEI